MEDSEGNKATIQIAGNDEGIVKSHTENDLILTVSTEKVDYSNLVNPTANQEVTEEDAEDVVNDYSNEIFINVVNFQFNNNVTKFSVTPKNLFNGGTSKTKKYYSYGAWGTNGVDVYYLQEDKTTCRMDARLGKLNHGGQDFYQNLWKDTFETPGEDGGWYSPNSGTVFYKFRLKLDSEGRNCSNDDRVTWS